MVKFKELLIKKLKSKKSIAMVSAMLSGVVFFVSGFIMGTDVYSDDYYDVKSQLETSNKKISDLEAKITDAEPWFKMEEEEQKKMAEETAKIEAERKRKEEEENRKKEALAISKIGERIIYNMGSKGQFALTIDGVDITSQRNKFADEKFDHVFEISYTVENISMDELDFFLDNEAEFYDADGYQCSSYPNTGGKATYDIAKGKKATGKEFYGVNGEKYLEMDLGGTIYKWQL